MFKPQEPSLAIVIPTCRPFKALKTIENAVKICYPGRKEVIVVVNGKGLKRHAKEIKRLFPQVKVIYIERRNKAAALNAGVKATRCSLVAVLDDDVLIPSETLKGAVSMFNPWVGAVAVRTVSVRRGLISIAQRVLDNALFHVFRVFLREAGLSYLNGAFAVIRRGLAVFNEDVGAEDLELSLRIQAVGYKIVYAPELVALTEPPSKIGGFVKRCLKWGKAVLTVLVAGVKTNGLRGFLLTVKHALRLGLLTRCSRSRSLLKLNNSNFTQGGLT